MSGEQLIAALAAGDIETVRRLNAERLREREERLEADLTALGEAAQAALRWIEDESEGTPSWCGEAAVRDYDQQRDSVANALRAVLASADSEEER